MIILKAFIAMFDMYVARNCQIIIKSRKTQKNCQTSALFPSYSGNFFLNPS